MRNFVSDRETLPICRICGRTLKDGICPNGGVGHSGYAQQRGIL